MRLQHVADTRQRPRLSQFLPDIQSPTTISAKVIEDRVSTAAGQLRADGYEVEAEYLPYRVRWRIRREGSVAKLDTTCGANGDFNLPQLTGRSATPRYRFTAGARWTEIDFVYSAKGRMTNATVRQTAGADVAQRPQIATLIDQLRG